MRLPARSRRGVGRPLATAIVGAALVGFVTVNLGIPLITPVDVVASRDGSEAVAGSAAKDKSVPFPCQNRPCGCVSADACMRSCCCFSAEERVAWFRAHNITPIPELIAAANSEHHRHAQVDCEHSAKVEAKPAPRGCCTIKKPQSGNDAAIAQETAPAKTQSKRWRVVMVVGSFAAQCHGMGPWSVTGFVAISPAASATYSFDWNIAAEVVCDAPLLLSAIHSPPTRPPCC